jgi:hypothetical protein
MTSSSVDRKPCQYHTTKPCGQLGESVEFSDGVHYVCDEGIREWNSKHEKKIFPRSSLAT